MRTVASLLVMLCVAAGPATAPATKPSLAPETREREGKVTVDAVNGGDMRLRVVKGDVYTFKVTGEWQSLTGKPWGPEGKGDNVRRKFGGVYESDNRSQWESVAVGKELRWTSPGTGHVTFPGLENPNSKVDRRAGQMVVKFTRVVTGKEAK